MKLELKKNKGIKNIKTIQNKKNNYILGIDAGTTRIGFAIILIPKNNGNSFNSTKIIDYGLMPITSTNHQQRIKQIYNFTSKLLRKYNPQKVIMERLYFHLNKKTAFEVSQAIGVINLACSQKNVPSYLITPTEVKKLITQKGNANKKEIINFITKNFKIKTKIIDDIADAIAIALAYIKKINILENNNE